MSTIDDTGSDARAVISARSVWLRAHIAFAAMLVVLALAYWTTLVSLVSVWANSGTFQYAFLIFPISVVLIWLQRPRLAEVTPRFSVLGIAGLVMVSVTWLAGVLASASILQHIGIIAAVPLAVLACYGLAVVRVLLFPLAYMFFAVPFGDVLVAPLQNITAHFSVKALQLSGATVYLEGHLIYMPVATFEVAEACSGVKFFVATTALGTLYAYLFYRSWLRRALFVLAALIAPIIANGLRVYFTVMIGEHLGMQYATGTDHLIFGWQFFGTVLVLLFLAGWYWREDPAPAGTSLPLAAGDAKAGWHGLAYGFVGLMALALGPTIAAWTAGAEYVPSAPQSIVPAAGASGGWSLAEVNANPLGTRFPQADAYLSAAYAHGPAPVAVYAAIYHGQPQGKHDLLTYGNSIYNTRDWNWVASNRRNVTIDQRQISVNETVLQGRQQRLVWYWYEIDGHHTLSRGWAKLLQIGSRLQGATTQSTVISVSTEAKLGALDAARARLTRYLGANLTPINQALRGSG